MTPDRRAAIRAALAAALLFVALCGVIGGYLVERHQSVLRPELVSKLAAVGRSVADQVALTIDVGVPFDAIRGMDEFLGAMAEPNPEIAYVVVADGDGRVLYGLGGGPERVPPPPDRQTARRGDGMLDVAVPFRVDGQVRGSVHVGLAEGNWIPWRALTIGTAVSLAAGALAAWLVLTAHGRRVTRPLARLRTILADPQTAQLSGHRVIGEMAALTQAVWRLQAGLHAHHAEALLELEEIALAQPEAEGRRRVRAILEQLEP